MHLVGFFNFSRPFAGKKTNVLVTGNLGYFNLLSFLIDISNYFFKAVDLTDCRPNLFRTRCLLTKNFFTVRH